MLVSVLHCFARFTSSRSRSNREYQRTTVLGGGVILVETVHVYRSAFTVIVESGGSAWFPTPSRTEGVIHQKLLRNSALLCEGPSGKPFNAEISPDRHYLLLWNQEVDGSNPFAPTTFHK